jgi:CRP-like cAMP-binding protein
MTNLLHKHIGKRIALTDEEFDQCISFFIPKSIRKKQFLLQEREVCKHLAFVVRGCLRSYTVDREGEEHIVQFAMEDWWISDLQSFLSEKPSSYTIDALEDSEILLLERENRDKLLETLPKLERFFRILLESNYIASHQRIEESLSDSAEERYLKFTKTYPQLIQRIPQGHVASYLGITPQSLSRIRKELSEKR